MEEEEEEEQMGLQTLVKHAKTIKAPGGGGCGGREAPRTGS